MKNLPEELIFALIFGAILLFQYLMKRFGPQLQQLPQEEPDPEFPEQEQEQAALETFPVSTKPDIRFGRSEVTSASPLLPRRRFSRQTLMGNRRDVQNAIVIATIVGRCRAYEPHDVR